MTSQAMNSHLPGVETISFGEFDGPIEKNIKQCLLKEFIVLASVYICVRHLMHEKTKNDFVMN